jgi:dCTP deaminase
MRCRTSFSRWAGDIVIAPFTENRLLPNADDWRLGNVIRVCEDDLDAAHRPDFVERFLPDDGPVLYLGMTFGKVILLRTFGDLVSYQDLGCE